MATAFSVEDWGKKFEEHDKDKSGNLDINELKNLLSTNDSKMSDSQIADMFVFMAGPKVNKDSRISKEEFLNGIRKIYEFVELATAFFKKYDADSNGHLSPAELRKLLLECDSTLKDETINDIIKAADTNKDGQVSLPEFLRALS